MARKHFTLLVMLLFFCGLVKAQDTKGDVQTLCYSVTGGCNGYSDGSDQSMIDMVGNGTTLPSDLFTGVGGDPTGINVEGVSPNPELVQVSANGGSGTLSSGVLNGLSQGVVSIGGGMFAINFGHGECSGGWCGGQSYVGHNDWQGIKAIVRELVGTLADMPVAIEGMGGGAEGGIPLPESMRNFSDKDLLLSHYDAPTIVEFKMWGGIKGQLGKIGFGNENNPDFIIPQVRKTIANGGLVRFNLKGFSIKDAMDPESMYYWGREQNWTSKEYQAIINNWEEFKDHVLFYTGPYPY